jgi:hypothetical protein
MRTLSLTAFLLLATSAAAQERPARWEYAELQYRIVPGRPALKDKDGGERPATPPVMALRWTAGTAEVAAKGWDELAESLKAPLKKESSASLQKIQVLNALGAQGWELMDQQTGTAFQSAGARGEPGYRGFSPGTTTTLLFKRRVP